MTELLDGIETQAERRDQNKSKQTGMKGMDEGYDPHMLDVSQIVRESWKHVTCESIAHFWVKAAILPVCVQADLNNKCGEKGNRSTAAAIDELIGLLNSVSLHKKARLFEGCIDITVPTEKEMGIWADVESSEALVEDIYDE